VSNFLHSRRFYQAALEPLGVGIVMEITAEQTGDSAHAGFGENGKPYFWIGDGEGVVRGRLHIAFTAKTRAVVDAFYQAALAVGGRDNGKPGLRPHYHAHYYGAFVLDPDGHNIEAVCHSAEA
jgi:catechol 2,3-dioxygenase-like lactoylglutathione lyase family enzyme